MDMFEDLVMNAILVMVACLVLFLLVGMPILAYNGAIETAAVWNRCHPSTQITVKEAFFSSPEITICETGALSDK